MFAALASVSGCISIRTFADDGTPEVIGVGSVREIPITEGRLFEVVTPGLSLGTSGADCGLSLGWHESLVFLPAPNPTFVGPAAIQVEDFGVALSTTQCVIGYARAFVVPEADRVSRVQFVAYSAADPTATVVFVREKL